MKYVDECMHFVYIFVLCLRNYKRNVTVVCVKVLIELINMCMNWFMSVKV